MTSRAALTTTIFAGAIALTLTGCSRAGFLGLDAEAERFPSEPPAQLAATDPVDGDLPVNIDAATVSEAIEHLLTPQPVTLTLVRQSEEYGALGSPDIYETYDTVMIDPSSTVKWVGTDHTQMAAAVLEELAATAIAEAESGAEETFLPSHQGLSASASVATNYVIDGDTMWLRLDDVARFQRSQIEQLKFLFPEGVLDSDAEQKIDDALEAMPNPEDWVGRWASRPHSPNSRDLYPPGLGADLDLTIAADLLDYADIIEVVDGQPTGAAVDSLWVTETGRTDTLVTVEVGASESADKMLTMEIDAEGHIRAIHSRNQTLHFDWSVDPSLMVAPDPATQPTMEETGTWLGINPDCMTEEISVLDPPMSMGIGCW